MIKKKSYLYILLVAVTTLSAQDAGSGQPVIKFGGYINWSGIYDSRQTITMREGQFLLYPSNEVLDREGNDINDKSSLNFLSLQSRLNVKISGPDALGAKTSAFIEGEFFGTSDGDANGFRLRHAYANLQWEKTGLLIGQYWHPMFVADSFPLTVSFNTGAPFQPFSRNPQLRLNYSFYKINLTATLYSQRDFASPGPAGVSSSYMRNSARPGMNFQIQTRFENLMFGGGVDYKSLVPRLETAKNISTDQSINSIAGTAFMRYSADELSFSTQAVYGENLADHLMLGGYGATKTDPVTGKEEYSSLKVFSIWGDFSYGSQFQFGLFGGYTRNFGSDEEIMGKIYSRSETIGNVFRISPRAQYNSGKIKFALEIEYTKALYGQPDVYGKIDSGKGIANTRILIGMFYNI